MLSILSLSTMTTTPLSNDTPINWMVILMMVGTISGLAFVILLGLSYARVRKNGRSLEWGTAFGGATVAAITAAAGLAMLIGITTPTEDRYTLFEGKLKTVSERLYDLRGNRSVTVTLEGGENTPLYVAETSPGPRDRLVDMEGTEVGVLCNRLFGAGRGNRNQFWSCSVLLAEPGSSEMAHFKRSFDNIGNEVQR